MTNDQTNKRVCPTCGKPAQASITIEMCQRLSEDEPVNWDTIRAHCVSPSALEAFHLRNEGVDPCLDCEHNEISHYPGTFVQMIQIDETHWDQLHECPVCQTRYKLFTD